MGNLVKVAITGSAGQIGYSLLFRIASGEVFGPDTKVDLNLLELPQAIKAAEGTAMELLDCGFATLNEVNCFDDAEKAFDGTNWALLVGAKPRGPGMERSDLILGNGPIFVGQGKALTRAASDMRTVVVGNPCNTNALIAQRNCPDVPAERFSAMTALDENRAKAQLALKSNVGVGEISNLAIWGNHSSTMYPDFENAKIGGKKCTDVITDKEWLTDSFITTVQKRGAAIIAARGKSSAASAASACIDHIKRFITPTPENDWFSAAIPSSGKHYGITEGIMFSFPLRSDGKGNVNVVENIELSEFAKEKIKASEEELVKEREVVKDLLG